MSGSSVHNMASGQSNASAPVAAPVAAATNIFKPCAILLDDWEGPILGGKALGVQSEVNSNLFMYNLAHTESSIGISLEFPLGQTNEDEGFGTCHRFDLTKNTTVPSDMRRIDVMFPREGFFRFVEPVTDALRSRFPGAKKEMSLVNVSLRDSTLTKVHGFSMPFKNREHPTEEFLNQGGVLFGKYTLLDILRREKFQIVVSAPSGILENTWDASKLPPPFAYPYGNIHEWDQGRYVKMLNENKGHQFALTWSYHDDNAHLAAMTQSQVQDVMWLDIAAKEIASRKFSAYFVESTQGNTSRYYVIMALSKTLKDEYESAMRRLTKDESFKLNLYDNWEDEKTSGVWDAKIMDHPQGIDALNAHPIDEHEMVLLVRRPLPTQAASGPEFKVITFGDRPAANAALKESVDQ
ncbi:hypothetical protein NW759_016003 [Fusarium solani]|nr:hypothetical protein NW759_016003 [Fusarium solani]